MKFIRQDMAAQYIHTYNAKVKVSKTRKLCYRKDDRAMRAI